MDKRKAIPAIALTSLVALGVGYSISDKDVSDTSEEKVDNFKPYKHKDTKEENPSPETQEVKEKVVSQVKDVVIKKEVEKEERIRFDIPNNVDLSHYTFSCDGKISDPHDQIRLWFAGDDRSQPKNCKEFKLIFKHIERRQEEVLEPNQIVENYKKYGNFAEAYGELEVTEAFCEYDCTEDVANALGDIIYMHNNKESIDWDKPLKRPWTKEEVTEIVEWNRTNPGNTKSLPVWILYPEFAGTDTSFETPGVWTPLPKESRSNSKLDVSDMQYLFERGYHLANSVYHYQTLYNEAEHKRQFENRK